MDPLATALATREMNVVVAQPQAAIDTGAPYLAQWLDGVTECWIGAAPRRVLVGFSAAGPRLAALNARFESVGCAAEALVFLDARLPCDGMPADAEATFAEMVDALCVDGVLPAWTSWWGDDALVELVPDQGLRDQLRRDCSPVPRAFFAEPIPAPSHRAKAAYVALGGGYDEQLHQAQRLGWPTVQLDSAHHLWVLTRPGDVAGAIMRVIEQL
jgi:hypothetical protein